MYSLNLYYQYGYPFIAHNQFVFIFSFWANAEEEEEEEYHHLLVVVEHQPLYYITNLILLQ